MEFRQATSEYAKGVLGAGLCPTWDKGLERFVKQTSHLPLKFDLSAHIP